MCGSIEFKFPGRPFANVSGREASAVGKAFTGRVFSGMEVLGYDFLVSSELSFFQDHSTWFFSKPAITVPPLEGVATPKERPALCLVTLKAYDSIYVMNFDDDSDEDVFNAVRASVEDSWAKGVQVSQYSRIRLFGPRVIN